MAALLHMLALSRHLTGSPAAFHMACEGEAGGFFRFEITQLFFSVLSFKPIDGVGRK